MAELPCEAASAQVPMGDTTAESETRQEIGVEEVESKAVALTVDASLSGKPKEDPMNTNLDFFQAFAVIGIRQSVSGFTKRQVVIDCCYGGLVEKYRMRRRKVVVKRRPAREFFFNQGKPTSERVLRGNPSGRRSEDSFVEAGVYGLLCDCKTKSPFLLEMFEAFQLRQEVWIVMEHAGDGDLLGVVSRVHKRGRQLCPKRIRRWAWQLLQAVNFLHSLGICHRDISLENVLLQRGDVRLMDWGQAVQKCLSTGELFRYFLQVGKDCYRPTEMYIPSPGVADFQLVAPENAYEGQIILASAQDFQCHVRLLQAAAAGQLCQAEFAGYTAPPVDIFESAVTIIYLFLHGVPWAQATLSDRGFQWFRQHGLEVLANCWNKDIPPPAVHLLSQMMCGHPEARPDAAACLEHCWFEPERQ